MSSTTDHVHEGRNETGPFPIDARDPEGAVYAESETEASFEEIER
jgi:hypothetical protein